MEGHLNEGQKMRQYREIKTFTVPFTLEEIKEKVLISTNSNSKISKEEIINQAFKLHSQGKILEAKKYYQYFINEGFQDHRVFSNYGVILKDLGKLKEAELSLRKAIKLNPDFAQAHSNLGRILKNLGKVQEAEISTRKAIELNPGFAQAHSFLGIILSDIGELKEAELSTRKAIELNPINANAYLNLGIILKNLGELKEAELSLRKAIELNPDFAQAHSNLGNIFGDLGKLKEAELSLRKAIKLNPDFADAYYNLSFIELLKGNYQSGLENYEFRFKKKKPTIPHIKPTIKKFNDEKLQKGKKLLVVSEQGLGDTIQYMRYIPYLRRLGLDVSFCPQPKLNQLIKASDIDKNPLTLAQASLISEGKWIPLLSLPRYLKVRPENPIVSKPYIYSKDELNKKWKNILSKEKRPIIAINWQGNPSAEKNYQKGRSLPLETFSSLAKHNNFKFLSLQKGFGSEQFDNCSFKNKFVKCQPQIDATWDFLETAAIIQNCDLIITSDTSIAHLAGGMGKSTWTILKHCPEWRWGLKGERTFWYPSMRLFRQKERHNWKEVMERVANTLEREML